MLERWFDDSGPIRPPAAGAPAGEHEQRPARADRLGTGTLACPACDAPVFPGPAPLSPVDALTCPWCRHHGRVREFLSLRPPTRPARVTVRVVRRARPVPR